MTQLSPTELYREYLLLDKPLVLAVPDKKQATYLLKLLRTAKQRVEQQFADLDLAGELGASEQTVQLDYDEQTATARYYLAAPKPRTSRVTYQILDSQL